MRDRNPSTKLATGANDGDRFQPRVRLDAPIVALTAHRRAAFRLEVGPLPSGPLRHLPSELQAASHFVGNFRAREPQSTGPPNVAHWRFAILFQGNGLLQPARQRRRRIPSIGPLLRFLGAELEFPPSAGCGQSPARARFKVAQPR